MESFWNFFHINAYAHAQSRLLWVTCVSLMTAKACVSPGIWSVAADRKCSRLVHQDDSNNQTPQLQGKGEKK